MASLHDTVVRILYNLAKGHTGYSEVYADHIGEDYKPLSVMSPGRKGVQPQVLQYNPDVWAKVRKRNTIDVLEVWDSQSESIRHGDCVEDVLLPALTANIETISIVCFEEGSAKFAEKLSKVILPSIHDEQGNPLLDPSNVLDYIVTIPKSMQKSEAEMSEFLSKKLNLERPHYEADRKVWYQFDEEWSYEAVVRQPAGARVQIRITDKEWGKTGTGQGNRIRTVDIGSVSRRNK